MLLNWPVIREAIVNEWGASRGFSVSKKEEEEQEEEKEEKPVMANSTQMLAEAIKLGSKRRKFAPDGSTFSISFSPDNDEFSGEHPEKEQVHCCFRCGRNKKI